MGRLKELVTDKAITIAEVMGVSMDEAIDLVRSHPDPIGASAQKIINDLESLDLRDTPPELGMASDYEDVDDGTQEVLKHILEA
jgi:hypothetical protein